MRLGPARRAALVSGLGQNARCRYAGKDCARARIARHLGWRDMMVKRWWALLALAALAGCSEEPAGGQTQQLHSQIQELTQQVRQYRAEAQRANEKIVAMLQAHGLQSDNPPAAQAAAGAHAGHGASGSAATGAEAAQSLHAAHASMDQQMMGVPITGDPDRDFLAMMIPHHQGAIDMARVVIASGKNPEVRKFAEGIIAHQQAEIDQMNRWLQAPR
jgi:uncharacterized protein (DUF305 family)